MFIWWFAFAAKSNRGGGFGEPQRREVDIGGDADGVVLLKGEDMEYTLKVGLVCYFYLVLIYIPFDFNIFIIAYFFLFLLQLF